MYVPKSVIDQHLDNPHGGPVAENRRHRDAVLRHPGVHLHLGEAAARAPGGAVEPLLRADGRRHRRSTAAWCATTSGTRSRPSSGRPPSTRTTRCDAALSAIEMVEALDEFNRQQREKAAGETGNDAERVSYTEWRIGVGVNYGVATVGDIGCEKKMIYNAIGRVSDFASELEGSTKRYAQQVIISERVRREVRNQLACRHLDIHPAGDTGRAHAHLHRETFARGCRTGGVGDAQRGDGGVLSRPGLRESRLDVRPGAATPPERCRKFYNGRALSPLPDGSSAFGVGRRRDRGDRVNGCEGGTT